MPEKQILNVSQGVWIDKQWFQKAGLGSRVQIELISGEIRIYSAPGSIGGGEPSQKGWNTFRSLGDNAVAGRLSNASENHDRYLYGKQQ